MALPSLTVELRELYETRAKEIRNRFHAGWDGWAAVQERSALVDQVALHLYRALLSSDAGGPAGFCLIAIGGFGRGALFPHSDVDILFLCQDSRTERVHHNSVARLCRELWDLRIRLSPTSRSLAECNQLHRDNLEFNIALLDCRYLAGDTDLFGRLREKVIPHLVAREFQALAHNLAELARQRHSRYGNTIFHLEPNLKESPGGLRDYNLAFWLALISELENRIAWPRPEQLVPATRHSQCERAIHFLAAVRCFLHYRLGRDDNHLTYELQAEAAATGVGTSNGRLDPADWMRAYFRHARSIHTFVLQLLDEVPPARSSLYRSYQQWRSRLSNAEFFVSRNRVFVRQPAALENPAGLLGLFEFVARHGLGLAPETEHRVANAIAPLRDSPPSLADLWPRFREILRLPHAADALRSMHALGVLRWLLPEFQCIDALVVRDYYHRYTVDEHSFLCIASLHNLPRGDSDLEKRFHDILAATEQPELLFLALLLHDVGKGMAIENHVAGSVQAVDGIVGRLELNPADAAAVRFLVANHLEMSRTLSRDLFDPETIRNFAEKVGTPARLKMLCLMTYADIGSVNPEALTPWRAGLLWRLYAATANHFTRSVDEQRLTAALPACHDVRHVAAHYSALPQELSAFLVGMPKRYLWSRSQREIEAHFEMARGLATLGVQLRVEKQQHSYLLTVVTADHPFLFATIAGMLAAWGMNIVKAEAFCNSARIVLDTFHFTDLFRAFDLNLSEVERFKRCLVDVISGEASLDAFLEGRLRNGAIRPVKVTVPMQVSFDNASSSHSTLLELIAQDRPGLLHQVASTLSHLGCNIEVALVETEGQKAIDVFYVTSHGAKLHQSQQHELRQALLHGLSVHS